MKALLMTLACLLLSQAGHAAGCTDEQAKRMLVERVVRAAQEEQADFTEVRFNIEKTIAGTRPYLINSQMINFAFRSGKSGVLYNGWYNVEVQSRNACSLGGSSGTEPSGTWRLSEYLQENNMGSLMRGTNARTSTPAAAPAAPPVQPQATAAVDESDGGE